jgi:hypothetical protein
VGRAGFHVDKDPASQSPLPQEPTPGFSGKCGTPPRGRLLASSERSACGTLPRRA